MWIPYSFIQTAMYSYTAHIVSENEQKQRKNIEQSIQKVLTVERIPMLDFLFIYWGGGNWQFLKTGT